jgi:hypothetical protein
MPALLTLKGIADISIRQTNWENRENISLVINKTVIVFT